VCKCIVTLAVAARSCCCWCRGCW